MGDILTHANFSPRAVAVSSAPAVWVGKGAEGETLDRLYSEFDKLDLVGQEVHSLTDRLARGLILDAAGLSAAASEMRAQGGRRDPCIERMATRVGRIAPPPGASPPAAASDASVFQHSADSSWRLAAEMVEGIRGTNENYLKVRADVATQMTDYYKDVQSLGATLAEYSKVADEKTIWFSRKTLVKTIEDFETKWGKEDKQIKMSDGANALVAEYAGVLQVVAGGVALDLKVLGEIKKTLNTIPVQSSSSTTMGPEDNKITVSEWLNNTEYNVWKNTFDGQQQQVQTAMRKAGEIYNQANTTFQNFVHLMMKLIVELVDSDKKFIL